ncbi:MAG: phosphopyruvate hydratase [Dehalococcoidia bacterium]|nr:phosphopyruvate hydratase [Dehalococcoidia bacterium]
MSNISSINAREVLDSRGNPTVEVDVSLEDGASGRALVPSGASTGANEAVELRDGEPGRYKGRGVLKAVENVNTHIAVELTGRSAGDQREIDRALIELDGTDNKGSLGANAILGVSLAVAHAAAMSERRPLYTRFNSGEPFTLPVPMFNVINGGRHAENSTDFQEFMVVPAGFDSFSRALQAGVEIYHSLMDGLRGRGLSTHVGDEGGFAPSLSSNRMAVDLLVEAIENAGYKPGEQCFIALDVAASELSSGPGSYSLPRENASLGAEKLVDIYEDWLRDYPIVSIEDGLAEDDWDSWDAMCRRIGPSVQLVGDDIFTTNPRLIERGIERSSSNAVLVKLNQIGTVSETLDAISMTRDAGWGVVISHRSGETEDSSIADLAVGTAAGQMKSGAPARGERTAKYNRLLRIEEELGSASRYAGAEIYEKYLARSG